MQIDSIVSKASRVTLYRSLGNPLYYDCLKMVSKFFSFSGVLISWWYFFVLICCPLNNMLYSTKTTASDETDGFSNTGLICRIVSLNLLKKPYPFILIHCFPNR